METQINILDLLTIISLYLQIKNLEENNEQTLALEQHLQKQDEQYNEIIKLLKKEE